MDDGDELIVLRVVTVDMNGKSSLLLVAIHGIPNDGVHR